MATAAKEFAPGIPVGKKIHPLPEIEERTEDTWRLVAQQHPARRAGTHTDLRFIDPGLGLAHSWATKKKLPGPGKDAIKLFRQPTHTAAYADYEGPIGAGYGETRPGEEVKKVLDQKIEVLHANPRRLRFNMHQGRAGSQEFVLSQNKGDKQWWLMNVSQTKEKVRPDLPFAKLKMKEIPVDKVDLKNASQVMTAKLDGASANIVLEGGKRPRLYSHRVPKLRPAGLLEYSHKVPDLYQTRVPHELGQTIVRGEIYATKGGKPIAAESVAGMLNSDTWKSLQAQKKRGKLKVGLFDVLKYQGKDMARAGYEEKLEALGEISAHMPQLGAPEIARTPDEKRKLLKKIQTKGGEQTYEGVVLHDVRGGRRPIKAKFKSDHDVYVRRISQAVDKKGIPKNEAGALHFSATPTGRLVGKVGTGFSRKLRRDMFERPNVYLGAAAKLTAQTQYSSGALGKPVFQGWHPDKSPPEFWLEEPLDRKGQILGPEKRAWRVPPLSEQEKISGPVWAATKPLLLGAGLGSAGMGLVGFGVGLQTPGTKKEPSRLKRGLRMAGPLAVLGVPMGMVLTSSTAARAYNQALNAQFIARQAARGAAHRAAGGAASGGAISGAARARRAISEAAPPPAERLSQSAAERLRPQGPRALEIPSAAEWAEEQAARASRAEAAARLRVPPVFPKPGGPLPVVVPKVKKKPPSRWDLVLEESGRDTKKLSSPQIREDEPNWMKILPAVGSVAGAALGGALRPGGVKEKALGALLGAGAGATTGWLPSVFRTGYHGVQEMLSPEQRVPRLPEQMKRAVRESAGQKKLVSVARVGEKTTGLQKEALDPLSIAGLGALSHVGANLLVKATHGTKFVRKIRAGRLATGIRAALAGKPQTAGSRIAETWLAPELFIPEHTGRGLGGALRKLPTGQRYRALKKLRKAVAMEPQLQHTPIFEDVVGGVNRALKGGLPTVGAVQQPTLLQKAAPLFPAPLLAVTEPAALVHAGVNRARILASKSGLGKLYLKQQLAQGVKKGLSKEIPGTLAEPYRRSPSIRKAVNAQLDLFGAKNAPSTLHNKLVDTFLSPAARDPARIGEVLAQLPATSGKRLLGAMHNIVGNKETVQLSTLAQQAIGDRAQRVVRDIPQMKRLALNYLG